MKQSIENMKERYEQFVQSYRTILMSTLREDGTPCISYAPFVQYENEFYIYISRTSEHHDCLAANRIVDIMIVADECNTQNVFARERARFSCAATALNEFEHEHIFELFATEHPAQLITMLRGLDFTLFRLKPKKGRYVVGFGQAFDINVEDGSFHHVVITK